MVILSAAQLPDGVRAKQGLRRRSPRLLAKLASNSCQGTSISWLVKTAAMIVALLLAASWQPAQAADTTYSAPDGTFQFSYSRGFQLYTGDQLDTAPAPCRPAMSMTALACVQYIGGKFRRTTFQDAVFVVNLLPYAGTESKCLAYGDWQTDEEVKTSAETINGVLFGRAVMRTAARAHAAQDWIYRTFHSRQCYELAISVGYSQDPGADEKQQFTSADAEKVFRALKPVLASFRFLH